MVRGSLRGSMHSMQNQWGSIREKAAQIKAYIEPASGDFVAVLIIILVGVSSFGLGRLSMQSEIQPAVQVYETPMVDREPMIRGGMYVASRSGSRYHYPWCPGAQTMSPENKIWFHSVEEARTAGYTPAGNCKGLE